MSLRATGEGHLSSIEFREGLVNIDGDLVFAPVSTSVISPRFIANAVARPTSSRLCWRWASPNLSFVAAPFGNLGWCGKPRSSVASTATRQGAGCAACKAVFDPDLEQGGDTQPRGCAQTRIGSAAAPWHSNCGSSPPLVHADTAGSFLTRRANIADFDLLQQLVPRSFYPCLTARWSPKSKTGRSPQKRPEPFVNYGWA